MVDWMVIVVIMVTMVTALSSSWFCPSGLLNTLQLQNVQLL